MTLSCVALVSHKDLKIRGTKLSKCPIHKIVLPELYLKQLRDMGFLRSSFRLKKGNGVGENISVWKALYLASRFIIVPYLNQITSKIYMKQWYTLYTKAHNEKQVASLLQEKGIETYLPVLTTTPKPEPFFPCYLFMNADLTMLSSGAWQWTPGLRRIVSRDQQPIPVSTEIIQLIKNNLSELNTHNNRHHHQFVPGDNVRVVNGPLKEMIAVFAGPVEPSTRVRILLSVLGQPKRIQLHVNDIEPVTTIPSQGKRSRRTRGRGRRIKQ